jgi:hypothetical protein
MALVLAGGFAAGIRAAAAKENTDPDILALMAQVPNDQAPGACDAPKASPSKSSSPAADCPAHHAAEGPLASDFVNIAQVTTKARDAKPGRDASTGTFISDCGRNDDDHRNPDNFIVAPGVSNGAHHVHDYVGNKSTDGFSTDKSLAAAGTTCKGGDRSAYFWPVLRYRAKSGSDANAPGGGEDGNVGTLLRPASVRLEFRGNAKSKVRAMPAFLRVITGDAKAGTNGLANARAAWTCTGFEDRTTTKYPICPQGSRTVRILDFPSCWDGKNTDSANHRSHIVFPRNDGSCWQKTVAVPQLRMTLSYDVPAKSLIALDTFPEQKHSPGTDHADFANLMPDSLMKLAVDCVNGGRECDADGPVQGAPGAGQPDPSASQPAPPPSQSPTRVAKPPAPAPSKNAPAPPAQPAQPAQPAGAAPQQPAQPEPGQPIQVQGAVPQPAQGLPADQQATVPAQAPPTADVDATQGSDSGAGSGSGSGSGSGGTGRTGTGNGTGGTQSAPVAPAVPAQSDAGQQLAGQPPVGAPAATKAAALPTTDSRVMLYVANAVALVSLGAWLVFLVRRRMNRAKG